MTRISTSSATPTDRERLEGTAAATEFLCTSISSGGDGVPVLPGSETLLTDNPNISLNNAQRGYLTFDIAPSELRADLNVMNRVSTPGGELSKLARFAVAPDRLYGALLGRVVSLVEGIETCAKDVECVFSRPAASLLHGWPGPGIAVKLPRRGGAWVRSRIRVIFMAWMSSRPTSASSAICCANAGGVRTRPRTWCRRHS